MEDVSRIIEQIQAGQSSAAEDLLPLVYEELKKLAAARLANEPSDATLQPTALVHEAYIRLVHQPALQSWQHRGHFFSAAAEAMRRILIDRARARRSLKRGGTRQRIQFDNLLEEAIQRPDDFLTLHEALDRLTLAHPRKSQLVLLRFFSGLTGEQAAAALGIATATADADWAYARSWLRVEMEKIQNS